MMDRIPFKITDIYTDMSNAEYHSHGGEIISSSFVKTVCKRGTVAHALVPMQPNDALAFGSAFHDYMENDGKLGDEYMICDLDRRTKAYKEIKAENPHLTLLKPQDLESIERMYFNVINNESYKSILQSGRTHREYSYFGECDSVRYRIRFDLGIGDDAESIQSVADYKTCQSIADFKWDFKKYFYDVQAVFYSDFLGIDPSQFYFVAVEKTEPYASKVFAMSEQTIQRARERALWAMDIIKTWKVFGADDAINHELEFL